MSYWNITFILKGPAAVVRVPNKSNPVEAVDLKSVLLCLAEHLPCSDSLGIETIGVEVESVEVAEGQVAVRVFGREHFEWVPD